MVVEVSHWKTLDDVADVLYIYEGYIFGHAALNLSHPHYIV